MQSQKIRILGDWGTTHLRMWLVRPNGEVLDSLISDQGAGSVSGQEAREAFLQLTAAWRGSYAIEQALLCGMVGKKGGWIEAPYLPADYTGALSAHLTRISVGDLDVFVIPGLKSPSQDDVMRGEETQIIGMMQAVPGYTGRVCMPGTHSKWCQISDGRITGFHTEMTGELFALLCRNSLLRDALGSGYVQADFDHGVAEGLDGVRAMSHLFSIRANWLLKGTAPEQGVSRLSGLLIGSEIARAQQFAPLDRVHLIGSSELNQRYHRALNLAGVEATCHSGEDLVFRGLTGIARDLGAFVDG